MTQPNDPIRPEEALEPEAMERKPFLQALSWFTGVVAGGTILFLTIIKPSVVVGATRAGKAMWQLRTGQTPPAMTVVQADNTDRENGDGQQTTAP